MRATLPGRRSTKLKPAVLSFSASSRAHCCSSAVAGPPRGSPVEHRVAVVAHRAQVVRDHVREVGLGRHGVVCPPLRLVAHRGGHASADFREDVVILELGPDRRDEARPLSRRESRRARRGNGPRAARRGGRGGWGGAARSDLGEEKDAQRPSGSQSRRNVECRAGVFLGNVKATLLARRPQEAPPGVNRGYEEGHLPDVRLSGRLHRGSQPRD